MRFISPVILGLYASCLAQTKLEAPTPLLPNAHTPRHALWVWTPVEGATAYRIKVHSPSYAFACQIHDIHSQMPEGTLSAVVDAKLACTKTRCEAVLNQAGSAYSPLTGRTAVLIGGKIPTINVSGIDCFTHKNVIFTYTIQALSGGRIRPISNKELDPPWKLESADSPAVAYWLDTAMPDTPPFTGSNAGQAPPKPNNPPPPPPNHPPSEPFYVARRYPCVDVSNNSPTSECQIEAWGKSCADAASKLLADVASRGDICRMCEAPKVVNNTRKYVGGDPKWVQGGACQGYP
jgi:hypothetical protein